MNTSLTLHSFDFSALDRADIQPSTRAKYRRQLELMLSAGVNPFDFPALQAYSDGLSNSARAFLKAALKIKVQGELLMAKSQATPENIQTIQALIARIEAMDETIKIHTPKGEKSHLWLSPEQVTQITSLPDRSTVTGRRDWIVLALLLTGLRREEAATITFDRLTHQPMPNGQMRAVLDITGKGAKDRVVPISALLEQRLKEWKLEAGNGKIARAINKAGKINGSLSAKSIYVIVGKYGAMIGLPALQPHDLRRSFAEIGWQNTHDLMMVMTLLGHESPETTRRYLNLRTNLEETISDYIPLA